MVDAGALSPLDGEERLTLKISAARKIPILFPMRSIFDDALWGSQGANTTSPCRLVLEYEPIRFHHLDIYQACNLVRHLRTFFIIRASRNPNSLAGF